MIVSVPSYIILFIINTVFVAGSVAADPYMTQEEYMVTYMTLAFLPTMLITLIISVLYYGLLTASKMQGTLGKKILGLKVVNEQGERITIGQGIGRYFAYILSGIIFYIGFIMIAFGEKKGLHDIICKTRVVYK
ncbi:RDD family protein [Bacillus spizizenii]|uniref:RDD family protein n=1 Tax=Bacillus spizizenii TaxID=96241 RepID=UPI003630C4AC